MGRLGGMIASCALTGNSRKKDDEDGEREAKRQGLLPEALCKDVSGFPKNLFGNRALVGASRFSHTTFLALAVYS